MRREKPWPAEIFFIGSFDLALNSLKSVLFQQPPKFEMANHYDTFPNSTSVPCLVLVVGS